MIQKQLDTNFRIMEQIRARVDAIVKDPKTAEALKPYYPYGCKRPTFHDEYLPTFNLPHVHAGRHRAAGRERDQRPRRRA
jgi:cyclohexanone monooxygenase